MNCYRVQVEAAGLTFYPVVSAANEANAGTRALDVIAMCLRGRVTRVELRHDTHEGHPASNDSLVERYMAIRRAA